MQASNEIQLEIFFFFFFEKELENLIYLNLLFHNLLICIIISNSWLIKSSKSIGKC